MGEKCDYVGDSETRHKCDKDGEYRLMRLEGIPMTGKRTVCIRAAVLESRLPFKPLFL